MINAFSVKLWWKLRTSPSLCSKYMAARYFKHSHSAIIGVNSDASQVWQRLLKGKDVGESHIRLRIGGGAFVASSEVWTVIGRLQPLDEAGVSTRVQDLWRAGGVGI